MKYYPVDKYLFKVSKITLEQRPNGRCSNVILLTLNRYLSTGLWSRIFSYMGCELPYQALIM